MKKLFALLSLVLLFAAAGKSGNDSSVPQNLETRALAAARPCANAYWAPHASLEIMATAVIDCFENGTTGWIYEVYVVYSCPPQHLTTCLTLAPQHAATVIFDCDGTMTTICH